MNIGIVLAILRSAGWRDLGQGFALELPNSMKPSEFVLELPNSNCWSKLKYDSKLTENAILSPKSPF